MEGMSEMRRRAEKEGGRRMEEKGREDISEVLKGVSAAIEFAFYQTDKKETDWSVGEKEREERWEGRGTFGADVNWKQISGRC